MRISSAHKYRVGRLPSSKIKYVSFSPCGCFMSGWRNPEQVSARLRERFSHDLFDLVFDTRDLWILSLCHTTDYEVCMVMGQNPGTYIIYIYPKIAGVAGCWFPQSYIMVMMINDWLWPNPIWQQVWCNEGLDDFKNRTSAAQKAPEWLSYWTSEDSSAHGTSKQADPEELWATNIRPLKGYSLVPIHSTSVNQAALLHLGITNSSKLQAPALCSSGGIIPDSSLSQEGSGRFQPDPLDQEHRFHPRSSWERPSGDVSSHVSPTPQVSLVDQNLGPVMGRIFFEIRWRDYK